MLNRIYPLEDTMQTLFLQFSRALAFALAGSLAAFPVYAEKDKDKEHHGAKQKKDKHNDARHEDRRDDARHEHRFTDNDRVVVRNYYTQEYHAGRCPPGLAKKHNGCMPPGQAKKWNVGQTLPTTVRYYEVPQPVLVRLPPPPPGGYRYVRVYDDILLLSPRERLVVDVIRNFGLS